MSEKRITTIFAILEMNDDENDPFTPGYSYFLVEWYSGDQVGWKYGFGVKKEAATWQPL